MFENLSILYKKIINCIVFIYDMFFELIALDEFSLDKDEEQIMNDIDKEEKEITRKKEELIKRKDIPAIYLFALHTLHSPFPEAEDIIATSAEFSYSYAKFVLSGRFEKGEKAISENVDYSMLYSKFVLDERFPMAEKLILKSKYKDIYLGMFNDTTRKTIKRDNNVGFYKIYNAIYKKQK